MLVRPALAAVALGGALALGAVAVPAQAAEGTTSTAAVRTPGAVQPMSSWHFYRSYWTLGACIDEGDALGYDYKCVHGKGTDGQWKYHLYLWY